MRVAPFILGVGLVLGGCMEPETGIFGTSAPDVSDTSSDQFSVADIGRETRPKTTEGGKDSSSPDTAGTFVWSSSSVQGDQAWECVKGDAGWELPDGSKLIASGGSFYCGGPFSDVFVVDPQTEHFRRTTPVGEARFNHGSVVLVDGRVLVCGGRSLGGDLASCERFDPTTETWSFVADMPTPRYNITMELLADGRVVVTTPPELSYDPIADTWTSQP